VGRAVRNNTDAARAQLIPKLLLNCSSDRRVRVGIVVHRKGRDFCRRDAWGKEGDPEIYVINEEFRLSGLEALISERPWVPPLIRGQQVT